VFVRLSRKSLPGTVTLAYYVQKKLYNIGHRRQKLFYRQGSIVVQPICSHCTSCPFANCHMPYDCLSHLAIWPLIACHLAICPLTVCHWAIWPLITCHLAIWPLKVCHLAIRSLTVCHWATYHFGLLSF
jgi:hypothetical protein